MGNFAQSGIPWADVPFLLALARSKSFMAAAEELNVDRTTVARRLERIESHLNGRVFERNNGQLTLTAQGRRITVIAERAEQELSEIQSDVNERRKKYGKVRISVSEHVLSAFADQFATFSKDHPEVFLELATSDRFVDPFKYEADIVLRIGKSPPSGLHSIDLGEVHFAYYRRRGDTGPLQAFWPRVGKTDVSKSLLKHHPEIEAVAAIDGVLPSRDLVLAGGGTAVLPCFLGDQDRRLAICSEVLPTRKFSLFVGCLPEQRNLHRIKLVMKNLSKSISTVLLDTS
jgi:DNA-binding transcriptional LysR family regulator